MKHYSSYILQAMQLLTVIYLFVLTLMPVEVRWAESYMWLLWSLPVLYVIGIYNIGSNRNTYSLRITFTDAAIAIWSLYYVLRTYIGSEYPCATDFLKTCTIALLYISLRVLFANTNLSHWWIVSILLLCGVYESIDGIIQMINGTSRHHLYMLTGNFQNPGPFSAYLMLGSVVGVCAVRERINLDFLPTIKRHIKSIFGKVRMHIGQKYQSKYDKVLDKSISFIDVMYIRHFIVISTALMLVVLPSTWSRAAFVGLVFCTLFIYRGKYKKYKYAVWGLLCIAAISLYFIKQGSADGRTMIWMSLLSSWMHEPWIGVGIGGFRHACAEGIAELWNSTPNLRVFQSAGVTDYAYNALLKVLVEQGLIGTVLCILSVLFAMMRLCIQSKPLFMGILSLLIFSMFSYPFELLPYCIIVVVIIAWSESCSRERFDNEYNTKYSCISRSVIRIATKNILICKRKAFVAISILVTAVMSCCFAKEIRQHIDTDKDCNLFTGMHNAAFINDYYELLPYELDNPQFLFDFAKTLRENKRYRDSNAILRLGIQVSADPMFYVIMGNNYSDESFYDDAEKAYKKAFSLMPNRLYPLYQLMLMYRDNKEMQRAKTVAKQIIELEPKIQSPATDEMKQNAKSLL